MKKKILLASIAVTIGLSATAQKVTTKVIDNKGTIKWVIDSSTAVITQGDSTILYVTPSQLNDSMMAVRNNIGDSLVKYSDTASMLAPYVKDAGNGLTKNGQSLELGGTLTKVTTIQTTATEFLAITGLQPGSNTTDSIMVVDPTTGQVKYVSPTTLFNALKFSNGLTKSGDTVKLGGALTEPTTISTDAINVLKIDGLQSGSLNTDSLVVAGADGTLRRVSSSSLLQSGEEQLVATASQVNFPATGMPADATRVWVYRNGAKLLPGAGKDYTVAAGTVTFTNNEFTVAAGDVIEIQWVR